LPALQFAEFDPARGLRYLRLLRLFEVQLSA
jgi:hypothetical protein